MKIIALTIFCFVFFLLSPHKILAQAVNCDSLNVAQLSLFNLRLNMLPEEAQNIFGKDLKIKVKKADEKNIFQNYIKEKSPPYLNGVRALYLRFFDRRLYQIEIFFEESAQVKTLADFTGFLSSKFNFPPTDVWQTAKGKSLINCGEFTISADKILNPRVELTDETGRAAVEAAREEKKKKK